MCSQVADAYGIYAWNKKTYLGRDEGATSLAPRMRDVDAAREQQRNVTLNSRAIVASSDPYWELSLMSVPPNGKWSDFFQPQQSPTGFTYEADDTYGRGQTIYLVEDGIPATHPVRPTPVPFPVCHILTKYAGICFNLYSSGRRKGRKKENSLPRRRKLPGEAPRNRTCCSRRRSRKQGLWNLAWTSQEC